MVLVEKLKDGFSSGFIDTVCEPTVQGEIA